MTSTRLRDSDPPARCTGAVRGHGAPQRAWARFRNDRAVTASIGVMVLLIAFALAAPLLAARTGHTYAGTYPRTGLDATGQPVGPGRTFWLGADQLGRDVLVRAAYGARVSLAVGVAAASLGTVLGVVVGLVAGFTGGLADTVLGRLMEIVLALPYLLIAIVLATTVRLASTTAGMTLTILTIGFFSFPNVGRIVRAKVLSLREAEFVVAARALGAGPARIMCCVLLPNTVAEVSVLGSLMVPTSIMFEATMSFLGIGVRPPTPSWGSMLAEGAETFGTAWWLLAVPGGLLLLTTLSCTLLADRIRHALTPRTEFAGAGG